MYMLLKILDTHTQYPTSLKLKRNLNTSRTTALLLPEYGGMPV